MIEDLKATCDRRRSFVLARNLGGRRRSLRQAALVSCGLLFSAIAVCSAPVAGAGNQPGGERSGAVMSNVVPGLSASGNYLAARFAQRRDDWPNAWQLMSAALTDDEANTELVRQGFLSAVGAGEMIKAVELAKQIVTFDPQNYFATTLLVAEEFHGGRYAEAKERLAGMSRRGANRLLVPVLLGWAEAGLGNGDAALAALKAEAAANPLFFVHGGLIADHLGKPADAVEWFEQLGERTRVPGRTARQIGAAFERAGQPDKARAYYQRWAELGPETVVGELVLARMERGEPPTERIATVRNGAAELFLDVSAALRQENANDLALLYAKVAEYLQPGLPTIQILVGDVLAESGRYDEAIRHYSQVDRTGDMWWIAQLRTADALERAKRTDEAVAQLRQLAADFPQRVEALTLLGDFFRRAKRYEEAATAYDQALQRVPEIHQRHWSLIYARGVSLERAQKWPEAERDLLKALELQPNHPQILNYLAYAWADKGANLDRAHQMLQRAVELKPNDGHIIDSLGWVLYRLGRYDEAVAQLERAVELEPQEADVNEHLGDLYWQVGRRLEARFQWHRALQQTTEDKAAAGIREKLEHGLAGVGKTAETGAASR